MAELIILRRAFAPDKISGLLAAAAAHAARVLRAHRDNLELAFPPHWRWLQRSHACELTALDPQTDGGRSDNFSDTSLCAALLTPGVTKLVQERIGARAGTALVRCRTIVPAQTDNRGLAPHKEATDIRFPGLYVIWTPLTQLGVRTNSNAPGIAFEYNGETVAPELEAGDIAVFSGDVSHWTNVPANAVFPRVGCDIRIFPWSGDARYLPPESQARGQRPLPLRWPAGASYS